MNSRTLMSVFALMAMAGADARQKRSNVRYIENEPDKQPVRPKGCNHYRFNSMGCFTVNRPMDFQEYGTTIFEFFAINDKSAVRKFSNRNKR